MSSGLVYLSEFRLLNEFYRRLGYSLIDDKITNAEVKLVPRRLSAYTGYVAVTWTIILGVSAYDVSDFVNESHVLDKATSLVSAIRTILLQVCSLVLITTQAPCIAQVSADLADLEAELKFPIAFNGTGHTLVIINLAFAGVAVVSELPLLYFFDQVLLRGPIMWYIFYLAVYVVHGQTSCLVACTWAMFFTEAFAAYVATINAELEHVLYTNCNDEATRSFRELHCLFVRVMDAFELCDDMLGKFLAIIFPLNLLLAAPWNYWIIKEIDRPYISVISALGLAGLCAQMSIVSIYSMHPYKQAKKTWGVLTKLLVSQEHTPEETEQIREFRRTCQNQDFSFSGCGFFKVGPPLVVTIASAIITYTVILYQSENSCPGAAYAPVNATDG